jgi:sortase A
LPGQYGWSVIFGRQSLFGGPFRHLALLTPGDLLQVTTGQGTFTYKVTDLRLPRDPQPPPLIPGQSRLTLMTSGGAGLRGAWAPNQLVYVDASLIGTPASAPAIALPAVPASQLQLHRGAVTAIPGSQLPMQGDTSGLFSLVLWMQLLVFIVLAAAWLSTRWGRWQTWLVAAPALLAVVWVASENAFQMLPNLL